MIRIKRVYELVDADDGLRILVDRLWARGLSKERAKVDCWMREIAPSAALRRWFQHDPARYAEFAKRYRRELEGNPAMAKLKELSRTEVITLLYAARDREYNNAVVLKGVLADV